MSLCRGQFRIPAERTRGAIARSSGGHREGAGGRGCPLDLMDLALCCDLPVHWLPILLARDDNMSVGCPVCVDGVVTGHMAFRCGC